MRKEEPHPLRQAGMLRVQAPHEPDERARAVVGGEDGRRILASQRVAWMVLQRLREEAAVHIEQRWITS